MRFIPDGVGKTKPCRFCETPANKKNNVLKGSRYFWASFQKIAVAHHGTYIGHNTPIQIYDIHLRSQNHIFRLVWTIWTARRDLTPQFWSSSDLLKWLLTLPQLVQWMQNDSRHEMTNVMQIWEMEILARRAPQEGKMEESASHHS